jgi:hypothetical protein
MDRSNPNLLSLLTSSSRDSITSDARCRQIDRSKKVRVRTITLRTKVTTTKTATLETMVQEIKATGKACAIDTMVPDGTIEQETTTRLTTITSE